MDNNIWKVLMFLSGFCIGVGLAYRDLYALGVGCLILIGLLVE